MTRDKRDPLTTAERVANLVDACKDIANQAPTNAARDERALMQAQIILLAEILRVLWRIEKSTPAIEQAE